METLIRFLRRHPPRSGWLLFGLALMAVMTLPVLLAYSELDLVVQPAFFGVAAGLVLGIVGGRRTRLLMIVPAIFIALMLLELVPPWRFVMMDLRALLSRTVPRQPLMWPLAADAAASRVADIL